MKVKAHSVFGSLFQCVFLSFVIVDSICVHNTISVVLCIHAFVYSYFCVFICMLRLYCSTMHTGG